MKEISHYIFYHDKASLEEVLIEDDQLNYINLDKIKIPERLKVEDLSESKNRLVFSEYLGICTIKPETEMVGLFTYSIPYKYSYKFAKDIQFLPSKESEPWMLPPINFNKIKQNYNNEKLYGAYFRKYLFRDDFTNEIISDIDKSELKIVNTNEESDDCGPFNSCIVVKTSAFLEFQQWLINVSEYIIKKYGAHSIMMDKLMQDSGVGKNYADSIVGTEKYRYQAIGNVLERCMAYYFGRTFKVENRLCLKKHLNKKRKLYVFSSESHDLFKNNFFIPSIKDDFELVEFKFSQNGSGEYYETGWIETMEEKIEVIIQAIHENWGDWFVYSDVDVQFFREIIPILEKELQYKEGRDIVFQSDHPYPKPVACAGFFAAFGNEKTLRLWSDVRDRVKVTRECDQVALNKLLLDFDHHLNRDKDPLNWGFLPNCFYGAGSESAHFLKLENSDDSTSGMKLKFKSGWSWNPEAEKTEMHPNWANPEQYQLKIPKDIAMHHANYTIGIDNKVKLLQAVKSRIENDRSF